jgi:hypothetical protein
MARLAAQPRALARWAGLGGHIAGQVLAHGGRVGLLVAPLQIGQDALEGVLALDRALLARGGLGLVDEADVLRSRAAQQHVLGRRGQVLPGRLDVELVVGRHRLQQREGVGVAAVPALDGAAGQRQRREGDDAVGVEHRHLAQALTARAGAHRRVEGEQPRLQLRQRIGADRAGELAGEQRCRMRVHVHDEGAALGQAQGRFEALGQPLAQRIRRVMAQLDAVDDDVDVVLLGLLQRRDVGHLDRRPVDAEAHITLGLQVLEQLGELALAVAHHRRQQHQLAFVRHGQHGVHHLADRLGLQRQVVVGAEGRAGAGVQQAQVIVDLGDRADRGARVVRGGLLLDGNRGGQALDDVHVRLVHQLQELARIAGQALDITPLALGIQGVEGQRGLARAGQPGDDDQRMARQVDVDVLQVVGACAAHADEFRLRGRHGEFSRANRP